MHVSLVASITAADCSPLWRRLSRPALAGIGSGPLLPSVDSIVIASCEQGALSLGGPASYDWHIASSLPVRALGFLALVGERFV